MADPLAFLKYTAQAQQGQQGPGGFDLLPDWLKAILAGRPAAQPPMVGSLTPGGFDPSTINLLPGGFTPAPPAPQERIEQSPSIVPGVSKAVHTVDVPLYDPMSQSSNLIGTSMQPTVPVNILTGRDLYKYLWDSLPDDNVLNNFIEDLIHAGYLQGAVVPGDPNVPLGSGDLSNAFESWLEGNDPKSASPYRPLFQSPGSYYNPSDRSSTATQMNPVPTIQITRPPGQNADAIMHELGHAVAIGSNLRKYNPYSSLRDYASPQEVNSLAGIRGMGATNVDPLVEMIRSTNGYDLSKAFTDQRQAIEIPSTMLEAWYGKEYPAEGQSMSEYMTAHPSEMITGHSGIKDRRMTGPPLTQDDFDFIDNVARRVRTQAAEGSQAAQSSPPWVHPKMR